MPFRLKVWRYERDTHTLVFIRCHYSVILADKLLGLTDGRRILLGVVYRFIVFNSPKGNGLWSSSVNVIYSIGQSGQTHPTISNSEKVIIEFEIERADTSIINVHYLKL